MSALVSISSPREKINMAPISSMPTPNSVPQSPSSNKSAQKSFSSETPKTNGLLARMPSKKRLKWSSDKKQAQDCQSDNDNNKYKTIKAALSSASASSFFSTKPVEIIQLKKEGSPDPGHSLEPPSSVLRLTKNFEGERTLFRQPLSDDRFPATISEDESIPSSPLSVDRSSSRVSSGSCFSHSERVVQEILTTERLYVKNLQDIIEGYLGCMRKKDSPVSKENVQDLFMNIEEIYEFNRKFLEELEDSDDDPVEIAYCFVSNETGFQTYTEYCTKYPKSVEVLTECTRQKETAAFLQKIQMDLGHPLPLGSYLLKPVQRILKYHLLLQDIQKHFDKENDLDGYETVSDALAAMTGVAQYINEMKRKHEAALHVQEIQSQLSDFEGPDLTTYGNLVLEDGLRMLGTRTDRYLFLFERILLITKKRENGFTCKATLMLSNMMMTEAVPKEPLAFTIIRFDNQKVNYSFLARNIEMKNKWTLELKRLLLESLAASVPIKAKNLILGENNVDEEETLEPEAKKKVLLDARSARHSFRDNPNFAPTRNGSIPVVVKADYVEHKHTIIYPLNHNTYKQTKEKQTFSDTLSDGKTTLSCKGSTRCAHVWTRGRQVEDHNASGIPPLCSQTDSDPAELNDELDVVTPSVSVKDDETNLRWESCIKIYLTAIYTRRQGSLSSPSLAKRQSDKNNNVKEEESKSPCELVSDDEKGPETPVFLPNDVENTQDTVPTSPPPVESVSVRVVDWERRVLTCGSQKTEDSSSSRNSSIADEEADAVFLAAGALDRRRSAEDVFVSTREQQATLPRPRRVVSDDDSQESAHAPWVPKRSSSLKLLEARRSLEKCVSDSDLRRNREAIAIQPCLEVTDSELDITKHLDDITENSKIQKTVREVAKAFQEPSTTDSTSLYEKSLCSTSNERPTLALEDLLASIDRDLDETWRTISNAQLLESALRLKKEPLSKIQQGVTREDVTVRQQVERISNSVDCDPTERERLESGSTTDTLKSNSSDQDDRDLKAELVAWGNVTSHRSRTVDAGRHRTHSLERRRGKKMFEISHAKVAVRYSAGDCPLEEPRRPSSVYRMARQYSKRISDENEVRDIRFRCRSEEWSTSYSSFSESPLKVDMSPQIKIERVTKVTFSDSLNETNVVRRRRKPGHRSRDQKRASWSFEKSKSDIDGLHRKLKRERPRSLHEIKPAPMLIEFDGDESLVFPDGLDEGLEPAMLAGMKKDDIVVRGLVQHLVNKFNPDKPKPSSCVGPYTASGQLL